MPLISGNQPEFGLLLKNKFFLMFPEVGLSDVAIKVNCGYKCSDELNTSLLSFDNTRGIRRLNG